MGRAYAGVAVVADHRAADVEHASRLSGIRVVALLPSTILSAEDERKQTQNGSLGREEVLGLAACPGHCNGAFGHGNLYLW